MSDEAIPEDVMKAAQGVRVHLCTDLVCTFYENCECIQQIASALLAERAAERERCANHLMLTVNDPAEALRLEYGELTAQEVRTIRAVLTQQASSIRSSHE